MRKIPFSEEWRDHFTGQVLARGKEYYKKGKVKALNASENACSAKVLGTRIYSVEIEDLDHARPFMLCTCPHALGGAHCKHMAAVLFAWEEKMGIGAPDEDTELFPATEPEEQFFKMSVIAKNLIIKSRTAAAARKAVQQGDITLSAVDTFYTGRYYGSGGSHARATGMYRARNGQMGLMAEFSKDRLLTAECPYCGKYLRTYYEGYEFKDALCEHLTGLLMLVDEHLRKFDPGDASDYDGVIFLREARKAGGLRGDAGEEKAEVISLVPRLVRDYNELYLTFQIGKEKLYVAKNLQDIVEAESAGGDYELGKNQVLHFGRETFTEEARPFYRLIERQVGQARAAKERAERQQKYYDPPEEVKSRIALYGQALDDFFDLTVGTNVSARTKNGEAMNSTVKVTEANAKITLYIRPLKEGRRIEGVELSAKLPRLLNGGKYRYALTNAMLGRVKDEAMRALTPFFKATDLGEFRSCIGKKHIGEFYHKILPTFLANPFINVVEEQSEAIAKILPPAPQFAFYVDVPEEWDAVVLRGDVSYNDETFRLKTPDTQEYPLAPVRDVAEEHSAFERIVAQFPHFDPDQELFWTENDNDTLYRLLDGGLGDLMEIGEVHVSDAFDKLKIRRTPVVTVGVSVESNLLDLAIETGDITPEELLAILDSFKKKKKYHRLRNGDFISFEENDSLTTLSAMMDSLGVSVKEFTEGKLHLPLYRSLYVAKMLEEHEELADKRDRRFRSLLKHFNTVRESDYEVPSSLADTLRKYQVYGYKWLRTLSSCGFGGILADDMGLGKTLQMITVLLAEKEENGSETWDDLHEKSGTSLIICPASLVYNWEEEFHTFAPDLNVKCVTGTAAARKNIIADAKKYDALITSYDLLKRDIGAYEDVKFRYEVLDEAQYIKNQKAAAAKTVKIIKSDRRVALTGTPIENRLAELWSIFDFLMPGFLYRYEKFRTQFETPIAKNQDAAASETLKKMVAPFILRRQKSDVLKDLPEKLEETRYARFDEEQRRLYDAQALHMKKMIAEGAMERGEDKLKILAELMRIRQICCDPSLINEDYTGASAKREACLDTIRSAIDGGHKMLVFSQFTSMLALLEKDLAAEGIESYKIIGATPKEERMRLVHAFNENDVPVFLISLKAGGTGLNLTGADVVIHYDPWWNVAAQNQATDRAHRIGQTKQVSVIRLIIKDSIEENILRMQEAKKDLADAILSGEETSLATMSAEELAALLG